MGARGTSRRQLMLVAMGDAADGIGYGFTIGACQSRTLSVRAPDYLRHVDATEVRSWRGRGRHDLCGHGHGVRPRAARSVESE